MNDPVNDPAPRTVLVTGGAGFIGSSLVRLLLEETPHRVVTVDKLTYAGHLASLAGVLEHPRHRFVRHDLADADATARLVAEVRPDVVMHLAAESHVDRSIDGPEQFVRTNVLGTFALLEAARRLLRERAAEERAAFRFLHVSTDEVYGSLGPEGLFTERTPYDPRSPYSASKAASDHFAKAYFHTYGLPVVVTNCSNNYGPRQHPEKLIPTVVLRALAGDAVPVYGRGDNVRDWLYVEDHARGLWAAAERGTPGETYNIGTNNERTSLQIARQVCGVLDELEPAERPYGELIAFVEDRPGHDFRYAVDASKIRRELGWEPRESFDTGLRRTVAWYLGNLAWVREVTGGREQGRLGTRV